MVPSNWGHSYSWEVLVYAYFSTQDRTCFLETLSVDFGQHNQISLYLQVLQDLEFTCTQLAACFFFSVTWLTHVSSPEF